MTPSLRKRCFSTFAVGVFGKHDFILAELARYRNRRGLAKVRMRARLRLHLEGRDVLESEPRLLKIPEAGGAAIALTDEYALDPVWSPSDSFLVYSAADVGTVFEVHAVKADGAPHAMPKLSLNQGSRRLAFVDGDEHTPVILKGPQSRKEFWAVDLRSGTERARRVGPGADRVGGAAAFGRIRQLTITESCS